MTITTPNFVAQFADLLSQRIAGTLTEAAYEAALQPLLLEWMGDAIEPAALGANLNNTLSNWLNFITAMTSFFTISPTGGPNSNGTFVVVDHLGVQHTLDGYQLLASTMGKGDPAKVAAVIEVFDKMPPNTMVGHYVSPGVMTIAQSQCVGYCRITATASYTLSVLKNGAAVGTVTYASGQYSPTFAFTGGQISLVKGDRLSVQTASTPDSTLTGVTMTFASA